MRLIRLDYSKQIEPLVDYYYDNVHWSENIFPQSTFSNWLEKEYGAKYNYIDKTVLFDNPKNFTHFSLRWL